MASAKNLIITIDGGAASGKSSTSRGVARELSLLHVDTGSHYRAMTVAAVEHGLSPHDNEGLTDFLTSLSLSTSISGNESRICINGQTYADNTLRTPKVNQAVSEFASIPAVRRSVFGFQRSQAEIARDYDFQGVILEGRDTGSVIFPEAPFKFFLEADAETRSLRRARDAQIDSIVQRDAQDISRTTAPLRCPDDAIRIDTSQINLDAVIAKIVGIVRERWTFANELD